MKTKRKSKVRYIPFANNKGRVISFQSSMTLAQAMKLGVKEIKLEPIGMPIKDGWYVHPVGRSGKP